MKECEYQDDQVAYLRKKACWVKCLVGSALQSGLPDIMIRTKAGAMFYVENKVWRNKGTPSPTDMVNLLDGPQRLTILEEFWGYGIFCPIFAFWDVNEYDAFYYDGTHFTKGPWQSLADRLASITNDHLIHHRSIRSQEFNHRIRQRYYDESVARATVMGERV